MTAKAYDKSWYIPDLRKCFDERVEIENGILYRKANILQVWWKCNSLGEPFDIPLKGRETWTMPTEDHAIESFINRWAADDF